MKFELIQKHCPQKNDRYMRNLFRRHPDMFLMSYASMGAKINYLKRNLNRQLYNEASFPLLLHYNYSTVIWPRCELLISRDDRSFNLAAVLKATDEEFCN